eukprot:7429569-Pyramimonas_sp.AAC.1
MGRPARRARPRHARGGPEPHSGQGPWANGVREPRPMGRGIEPGAFATGSVAQQRANVRGPVRTPSGGARQPTVGEEGRTLVRASRRANGIPKPEVARLPIGPKGQDGPTAPDVEMASMASAIVSRAGSCWEVH